jgi:hypothetical protein
VNETLVLDTDVASFLFKNSPHVTPFRPLIEGNLRHFEAAESLCGLKLLRA